MKTRTHAADYYRRILSMQAHALKRLDPFAAIVHCHRGQEVPNNSGPAGHWYYVITGASGDAPSVRTGGDKSSI
jgi:CRP/FNR family transcriptional regulator, nitrogen fixation regulation protein